MRLRSSTICNRRLLHAEFLPVLLVLLLVVAPSRAEDAPPAPTPSAGQQNSDGDLERFLEELMKREMEERHITGATVAFVQSGQVRLLRGYGLADREGNVPVDPKQHVFRVASVSKSVTATATMRLVERGVVDIQADVNSFISPVNLARIGNRSITIADLLSHSAGVDDRDFVTSVESAAEYVPLVAYVEKNPPVPAVAPGQERRYSNQGVNLVGYALQRQGGGASFEQLVETEVFKPLGMNSSTFTQVLAETQTKRLAKRYSFSEGRFVSLPQLYVNDLPAGGMYTTADDMAHYMLMHLGKGQWQGQVFLSRENIEKMHGSIFALQPEMFGTGLGLFRGSINGHTLLLHDGDGPGVGARMALLPEREAGFFLAYTGESTRFRHQVFQAFMDKVAPRTNEVKSAATPTALPLGAFVGRYKWTRYDHTGLRKYAGSITMEISLRAEGDKLAFEHPFTHEATTWTAVGPMVFQDVAHPDDRLAFATDPGGRVSRLSMSLYGLPLDFERTPWYGQMGVLLAAGLSPSLVFLGTVFVSPLRALVRRIRKKPANPEQRLARWLVFLTAALGLFGMFNVFTTESIFAIVNPRERLAPVVISLVLMHLAALCAVALTAVMGRAWARGEGGVSERIGASVVAIAGLLYIFVIAHGNVLGTIIPH